MASRKESSSAATTVMASTGGTLDSPVKQIQIEGLVSVNVLLFGEIWKSGEAGVPDIDAKVDANG